MTNYRSLLEEGMRLSGQHFTIERGDTQWTAIGRKGTNRNRPSIVFFPEVDVRVGDILRSDDGVLVLHVIDLDTHRIEGQKQHISAIYESIHERQRRQEMLAANSVQVTIQAAHNSFINIGSHFTEVTQQIGALPQLDAADKRDLLRLTEELQGILTSAPADRADEAQKVAQRVKALTEEAAKPKPDRDWWSLAWRA